MGYNILYRITCCRDRTVVNDSCQILTCSSWSSPNFINSSTITWCDVVTLTLCNRSYTYWTTSYLLINHSNTVTPSFPLWPPNRTRDILFCTKLIFENLNFSSYQCCTHSNHCILVVSRSFCTFTLHEVSWGRLEHNFPVLREVYSRWNPSALRLQSICTQCNACVHMYCCTCLDFLLHTTICKHIHLVCALTNLRVPNIKSTLILHLLRKILSFNYKILRNFIVLKKTVRLRVKYARIPRFLRARSAFATGKIA